MRVSSIFLVLVLVGFASADLSDGLVAYWKLDQNADDSLNLNNGTLYGKTFNTGNVSGGVTIEDGAMVFDGVDGYVQISEIIPANEGSISVWFNSNNISAYSSQSDGDGFIVSSSAGTNDRVYLFIKNEGLLEAKLGDGTSIASISIDSKTDYNFVVTYSNSTGTPTGSAYLNGVSVGSATYTGLNDTPTNIRIGAYSSKNYFNGSINNVLIFNRSLSESEISSLYALGENEYTNISEGLISQYSGRDYNGTAESPTQIYDTNYLAKGKMNQAFYFDGEDDEITIGEMQFTSNSTFSAWIYPTEIGDGCILGDNGGDDFLWWIDSYGDSLRQGVTGGTGKYGTDGDIPLNEWTFVSVVFYGNNVDFYKNGIYDKTETGFGDISLVTNTELSMGSDSNGGKYFNGSIDDVGIWNRVLSSEEIGYLYNGSVGSSYPLCTPSVVNSSWSSWFDESLCFVNDSVFQNRSLVEYDENFCGYFGDVVYWDFQEAVCNYCSFSVVNSSWSDWFNGSCFDNNTLIPFRSLVEYDENYGSCYSVTGLVSDLWNDGLNVSYVDYGGELYCVYEGEGVGNSYVEAPVDEDEGLTFTHYALGFLAVVLFLSAVTGGSKK